MHLCVYVYIHVFIYIYIYLCVNLCFLFLIYVYIKVCVCGGGVSKWGVLFSSQRTLFGTKKRHLALRHIHVYTIYLFVDMCFLILSCVGLPHPMCVYIYICFLCVLLYVVFQHHVIGNGNNVSKMFHWRLQYR